jgi:hypothetical protein
VNDGKLEQWDGVKWQPAYVSTVPVIYDIATDLDRPATQVDVDKMMRTCRAFGELAKRVKFHHAEVRNGLVLPGAAIEEIVKSLKIAENTAASLNLDEMMQQLGEVHGRHILVVER